MKYCILSLLLAGLILFPSCGKKWKKPTHVSSTFLLNNANSGLVKIASGNLVVSEIDFNGTREQGAKNVSFVKSYDNGLVVSLATSKSVPDVLFDIPQGTYTQMNFNVKLKTFNNNPSITLNGSYTNTSSVSIPLVFNLGADESIETIPKSSNGGTEIPLVASKSSQLNININPNYWFQTITQLMFENVDLTNIGGVMTMIIDKDNNEDIYNLIIGRIKDGNTAIIE